jgi:hypothetical protein
VSEVRARLQQADRQEEKTKEEKMESREAKVILVPLNEVIEIVIEKAKEKPGLILPDPVPPIEGANIDIIPGKALRVTLAFAPSGAKVTVLMGGGGIPGTNN